MDTLIMHYQYASLTFSDVGSIASVLALLLTLLVYLVPPLRKGVRQAVRWGLLHSGYTTYRYTRWFLAEYRQVRNIYLDVDERLDLSGTYVSLSFVSTKRAGEQRVAAAQVLAETRARHILIVGDPGTGKSTLLKAYGIGILRRHADRDRTDLKAVSHSREVPFFVPLRHLGRYVKDGGSLAGYLVEQVLRKDAKTASGRELLQLLLRQHRCLLLLDGLDEVADSLYEQVRQAVFEFLGDEDPDLPTANARVVLSCRRQNFILRKDDWVPGFAERPYQLAPLRDAEIFRFLTKRRHDFTMRGTPDRTPEHFYRDMLASGTAEMHRVPLVLTISVGLYLHRTAYQIPRSIDGLYHAMVDERLRRRDFPTDPAGPKLNRFYADDKFRYLCAFAHEMAARDGNFEDFTFAEAVGFAREMSQKIRVRESQAEDFVLEIIKHSGLINLSKEDSTENEYTFAHRSIQEYLVAVHLQREAQAAVPLLAAHAGEPEWRQVILFFVTLEHNYVDEVVRAVAERNLALAGSCVGVALCADDVALPIIDELRRMADTEATYLWALIDAARAPRESVRDTAVSSVASVLSDPGTQRSLLSGLAIDVALAERLLNALADADAAKIGALALLLAEQAGLGTRLIAPLWRCLAVTGMEDEPASAALVSHLLSLVTDEAGLDELEAQPRYQPGFADERLRQRVYPFTRGRDPESNLVTLLCWAKQTDTPLPPSRFAEASRDPVHFACLERDERRAMAIPLHRPGKVLAYGSMVAAVLLTIGYLIFDRSLFVHPLGWWTLILFPIPGALAFLLAGALADQLSGLLKLSNVQSGNTLPALVEGNRFGFTDGFSWDAGTFATGVFLTVLTTVYGTAMAPLLSVGLVTYLVAAPFITWVTFWLPATELCDRGKPVYLGRRNPYLDVYQDPASRLWILPSLPRRVTP